MEKNHQTMYAVYAGKELCSVHFTKVTALMLKMSFRKGITVTIRKINAGKFGKFLIDEYVKSC